MISYPVDRAATARRWTFWRLSTSEVVSRNLDWPVADGGLVPGLDPDVVPLLQVTVPAPPIDSRLQVLVQGLPVVDLDASEIRTGASAQLRPAAELVAAVRSEAGVRKSAALAAYGVDSPTDQTRAIALLLAERQGQTLTEGQDAWLTGLGVVGVDQLDAIDAAADALIQWIADHPGELPDIGDTAWPVAPVAA
jgi:hypothetical protein